MWFIESIISRYNIGFFVSKVYIKVFSLEIFKNVFRKIGFYLFDFLVIDGGVLEFFWVFLNDLYVDVIIVVIINICSFVEGGNIVVKWMVDFFDKKEVILIFIKLVK